MGREFPDRPIVGVGAVVLRPADTGLEVLLVRRANPPLQGEWSLPGGMVELGERLETAIVREVLEETGLNVVPLGVVEVLDSIVLEGHGTSGFAEGAKEAPAPNPPGRVRFHYVLIDYLCVVEGGVLAFSSDASEVCWQPVNELRDAGALALQKKTITVIRKAAGMLSTLTHPG